MNKKNNMGANIWDKKQTTRQFCLGIIFGQYEQSGQTKTCGIGDYVPGSTPASLTPVILKDYVVPNTVIHFLKVKKLHNWTVTVYCMLFINKSKYLVDDDLNIFFINKLLHGLYFVYSFETLLKTLFYGVMMV